MSTAIDCGQFEAEGFGLPCTAWAGSGLLVKSRLIRIGADEGARERTRSFEIELVHAAAGRDIPIKRVDRHAIIYYVMHKQRGGVMQTLVLI